MQNNMKERHGSELDHLLALSFAGELYSSLADATVDVRVLRKDFSQTQWYISRRREIDARWSPSVAFLTRAESLASIAMFQSGRFDLEPHQMQHVMALSSGDSMYVAGALLRDPWDSISSQNIWRVVGNVGHAGIAYLLVLPRHRIAQCQSKDLTKGRSDGIRQNGDNREGR